MKAPWLRTLTKSLKSLCLLVILTGTAQAEDSQNPESPLELPQPMLSLRFTQKQRNIINKDLQFLVDTLPTFSLNRSESMIISPNSQSGAGLLTWLNHRIRYIIPYDDSVVLPLPYSLIDEEISYPFPDILPAIYRESQELKTVNKRSETLMRNLGTTYYLLGKLKGRLVKLLTMDHFREINTLDVTTPRDGIIEISPAVFEGRNFVTSSGHKSADRIQRLSMLFHEARHSDGHGESLGFYHVRCPSNSAYAGHLACDRAANGSYGVGAVVVKKLLEACDDCQPNHKSVLRLLFLDYQSRVLSPHRLTLEDKHKLNEMSNRLDILVNRMYTALYEGKTDLVHELKGKVEALKAAIKQVKNPPNLPKIYWNVEPELLQLDV